MCASKLANQKEMQQHVKKINGELSSKKTISNILKSARLQTEVQQKCTLDTTALHTLTRIEQIISVLFLPKA